MEERRKVDWKKVSNRLVEMHSELGGALVDREGNNAVTEGRVKSLSLVNTTPSEAQTSLVGKKLSVKQVRKFMWDHRNSRQLQRENAVIWSWYDDEKDETHLGFGATVAPEKVERGLIRPERVVSHGDV
jgi:hypothetical protein